MRVIAGRYRGRRLRSAAAPELRPTADRVKEALFSILAAALPGAPVVDLYAGTGGLGIEALSRGAARVTWVERDPRLAVVIRENLAALGVAEPSEEVRIVRGEAGAFLRRLAPDPKLVLLADPPYRAGAPGLLSWLAEHPRGFAAAALEHPAREAPGRELHGPLRADRRAYGNVGLTVFTPSDPPPTD
ncbi:MAG: RsmD family RNA methyltransferase [Gemmatimonadota bacterium]